MLAVMRSSAACLALALLCSTMTADAWGQYFRRPVSDLDPRVMAIDENAVLGARIDGGTLLIDQNGKEFRWEDVQGKPLILVLSYFTCDGSCSVINATLAELLKDVKLVVPGRDFRILTLSFDNHDNLVTTGSFRGHLELAGQLAEHWTFATFKRAEDLKTQTERIGFKFFWSPEDRVFLHPGAFLFFSPDGRLIRVLYQEAIESRDVEFAVLDAKQGQFRPAEIINFALSLCYSYSYHDGKYVLSIPVLVGIGSLLVGLGTLFGSILFFKSTRRMKRTRDGDYAEAA